jgi:hypothetical protein
MSSAWAINILTTGKLLQVFLMEFLELIVSQDFPFCLL